MFELGFTCEDLGFRVCHHNGTHPEIKKYVGVCDSLSLFLSLSLSPSLSFPLPRCVSVCLYLMSMQVFPTAPAQSHARRYP